MKVGDGLLGCHDIPYSIAGEQYKLRIIRDVLNSDIWVGRHSLFILRQVSILLVFEVAEGSR